MHLPGPVHRRIESALVSLMQPPDLHEDFSEPRGEPAFLLPDSVSWRIFKNPLSLFVGGVAGVILELAEPRVRTGVWDHSYFRQRPLHRLQRTALAAMLAVYGARSRGEAMIARVRQLHGRVGGRTSAGVSYRADDSELLSWVHATASFGFIEAYDRYVQPLSLHEHDRFYAEGIPIAECFGAMSAPESHSAMHSLLDAMRARLEPSRALYEFLEIVRRGDLLPAGLHWLQAPLVDAAITLVPPSIRERIELTAPPTSTAWRHLLVRTTGVVADRLVLDTGPAAASCRRIGWPVDTLYRPIPRPRSP